MEPEQALTDVDESAVVFNVVWTGSVFPYLRHLVASQVRHSNARFRFVCNACVPGQLAEMEAFATDHPDAVTEIVVVSEDRMVAHGECLDAMLDQRDDGDYFALIDSDILARGPFVGDFLRMLEPGVGGVTSGRGIWSEEVVVPEGHAGVNGEYFWSQDGFLFGSPHFGIYRRAAIDRVRDRWDLGFGPGGGISDAVKEQLEASGHHYWLYDTGKLMNIFIQEEGFELRHQEHDNLLHIGGMSHYLSPPEAVVSGSALERLGSVDRDNWNPARLEVAEFSAAVLAAACAGEVAPTVPAGLAPETAAKLEMVRNELIAVVPGAPTA